MVNTAQAYGKNVGGAKYAEEAYNIVSALNGSEHPDVQRAATTLIDRYVAMENFVDAGQFSRINYECLSDPNSKTDRKGVEFALAKKQLAEIWFFTPADQRDQGPEAAEEAETLMREACDIFENIETGKGVDAQIASSLSTGYCGLASVMIARGKTGSEVMKTIFTQYKLSFTTECRVGAVPRTELSLDRHLILQQLGNYFFNSSALDNVLMEKAKHAYKECVMIATALFSSDDQRLLNCTTQLLFVNAMLGRSAEDVNRILNRFEGEKAANCGKYLDFPKYVTKSKDHPCDTQFILCFRYICKSVI